jgi:intracellular sulfur oxidation DsrE/DsrF family protein
MMSSTESALMDRRTVLGVIAAGLTVLPAGAWAEARAHRLALQISDNTADKMNAVLNVAANVSRYYADKGEEVEIEIIAFNAGMHMLRSDTSPVKERMVNFRKSMTNVAFKACGNTMAAMERNEGHKIPLLDDIPVVPAGVTRLIELSEKGWTIVRP